MDKATEGFLRGFRESLPVKRRYVRVSESLRRGGTLVSSPYNSNFVDVDMVSNAIPRKEASLKDKALYAIAQLPSNLVIHYETNAYIKDDSHYSFYTATKYSMQVYGINTKILAVELDKKYEDNIRDQKKVCYIHTLDGKITWVDKSALSVSKWNNLINNCGVFRNEADAVACKILLKKLGKQIWKN